jgi:hypothetical protein
MPFIYLGPEFEKFGFRKIWNAGKQESKLSEAFNFDDFMDPKKKYVGLTLEVLPFTLQILNCFMIVFVFS